MSPYVTTPHKFTQGFDYIPSQKPQAYVCFLDFQKLNIFEKFEAKNKV